MSIASQLREQLEKQLALANERLNAAQAEAKAKKAQAEADMASAELEEEVLQTISDLRARVEQGQAYLQELLEAGDEKAGELRERLENFFDD